MAKSLLSLFSLFFQDNPIDIARDSFTAKLAFVQYAHDAISQKMAGLDGMAKHDRQIIGEVDPVKYDKMLAIHKKNNQDKLGVEQTYRIHESYMLLHLMLVKIMEVHLAEEQKARIEEIEADLRTGRIEEAWAKMNNEDYLVRIRKIAEIIRELQEKYKLHLLIAEIMRIDANLRNLHLERQLELDKAAKEILKDAREFKVNGVNIFSDLSDSEIHVFTKEYLARCVSEPERIHREIELRKLQIAEEKKPMNGFELHNAIEGDPKIRALKKELSECTHENILMNMSKNHKNAKVQMLSDPDAAKEFVKMTDARANNVFKLSDKIIALEKSKIKVEKDLSRNIVAMNKEVVEKCKKENIHVSMIPKQVELEKIANNHVVETKQKIQETVQALVEEKKNKDIADVKEVTADVKEVTADVKEVTADKDEFTVKIDQIVAIAKEAQVKEEKLKDQEHIIDEKKFSDDLDDLLNDDEPEDPNPSNGNTPKFH